MEITLTKDQAEKLDKAVKKVRVAEANVRRANKELQESEEYHNDIFSLICDSHNIEVPTSAVLKETLLIIPDSTGIDNKDLENKSE